MLPILRILPVGGVFLAIQLLVLALNSPASMHSQLTSNVMPMRGTMIAHGEHPEWRQFLILSAIRRADELSRLCELPDTPARTKTAPPTPKIASVPIERSDTAPDVDDETGSILQPPPAPIPIDIGESSSIELPLAEPEEQPPVIRTPQLRSRNESRLKGISRVRRARAADQTESARAVRSFQGDVRRTEIHAAADSRHQYSGALARRPATRARFDY
jgi:hypothetical protein